jgi:acyl phosphate:glycerol-3-phosphate acyltransferase
MSELCVKALLAYLLGSLVGSLVIGAVRGVDIRTLGSGNAGATNAMRTQGKAVGAAVFVIDLLKGWIATGLLAGWALPWLAPAAAELAGWRLPVCALAVILGHVYPVWFGFRGGKGVATLLGALQGIAPVLVLVFILAWLVVVILTGFVGLASICAAVAVVPEIALAGLAPRGPLLAFGVCAALLILYTHRANVARTRAGSEPRAQRLWLLGTRRGAG